MLSAGSAPSVPAAKLVMAHDPASLIEPPARVTLAGNGWGVAAIVGGAVSGLAIGGECYAPHENPRIPLCDGPSRDRPRPTSG